MRGPTTKVTATLLAVAHVGVLLAPALILAFTARKGGVPGLHGYGLVVASGSVGLLSAALASKDLWLGPSDRSLSVSALIAAWNGLVVLAVAATGLLFVVLGAYAPLGNVLVNEGWPFVGLWTVIQLAAVVLAELTRRGVSRWLVR